MSSVKDVLFRSLNFSKGYIYGFIGVFLVPRTYFDQMAMAYYDILDPDVNNQIPAPKKIEEAQTK
jgi:hypothetical protein